uniref:Putative secreted peptide n=1 Tax=Anopheles braziliensis TaxID=58242 RepID=A0A2M3ZUJ8_9DIPT
MRPIRWCTCTAVFARWTVCRSFRIACSRLVCRIKRGRSYRRSSTMAVSLYRHQGTYTRRLLRRTICCCSGDARTQPPHSARNRK